MPKLLVLLLMPLSVFAQTIQCSSSCTVTLQHDVNLPLLQLSLEDASLLAAAIAAVWAVGWAFRVFIRTLNSDSDSSNHESP